MAIPIMAILGGAAGGVGLATMFPPFQRSMSYGMNRLVPNEVLSPADAIEAYMREVIGDGQLSFDLKSAGLKQDRIEWLKQVRESLLGAVEAITLWRREEIEDGELNERLKHLGFKEETIPLLVKFTEVRPGVQDIIRFAVREVYTPEIAEAFGQFEGAEGVSATAEKDLKAAGIRPEDLGKYWAAHWELPSVQMGYEMLHRGVIDDKQLDMLMRALDVMPFWRGKLKDISYHPLTRVDVRRMHKLGVIGEGDLVKAYQDLGYNLENAQRLADFTIKYNADPESSEQTETDKVIAKERDLTKTDLLNGYADGLFTDEETGQALMNLGYSENDADYFISRVNYTLEKDTINKYIKGYHDAYIGNAMSYNEVVDALSKLNLSGTRIATLFNLWDMEKSLRTQKPTKAEILTFLRKKVIDKQTAIEELQGQGYQMKYINWYLQTA